MELETSPSFQTWFGLSIRTDFHSFYVKILIIVWQCATLTVGYYTDPHLNINLQPSSIIKTTTYKATEITSEDIFSKYLFVHFYGVLCIDVNDIDRNKIQRSDSDFSKTCCGFWVSQNGYFHWKLNT